MIDLFKEKDDLIPKLEELFPPLAFDIDPTAISVTQLKGEYLQQ